MGKLCAMRLKPKFLHKIQIILCFLGIIAVVLMEKRSNQVNKERRKKHPYATLAVFTIAAASMINVANKAKNFVKNKTEMLTDMIKHKIR